MKRRTLDIAFSIGGMIFAVLLLVVGLILSNQASFAKSYVHDQLVAHSRRIRHNSLDMYHFNLSMALIMCLVVQIWALPHRSPAAIR